MEGEAGLVALVCYSAPCRCPACGHSIAGGVEHIRVAHGRADIEWLGEPETGQVVVHGIEGPAVFDRSKVQFVRLVPENRERRR